MSTIFLSVKKIQQRLSYSRSCNKTHNRTSSYGNINDYFQPHIKDNFIINIWKVCVDRETFLDFAFMTISNRWTHRTNKFLQCHTDTLHKKAFREAEKLPIKETKEVVSAICLSSMSLWISVSVYNSRTSDREKLLFVLSRAPKWQISITNRFCT